MSLEHADTREFQQKSLELISSLVSLSSSAFFLVDPGMQHKGAVLYNLAADAERAYASEYGALDPLHPERFANSNEVLVTLDSRIAPHHLKQTLYYQNFMVPFNHRYVVDMFFRREGRIIAGLSIMREESLGNFCADALALLRKVQPFLEYALNAVYLPRRESERQDIAAKYELTERELDVLELVLRGSSNKAIATDLALGEATVKTHLIRIFRKTDVKKRSELVAKILLDLNG